MFGIVAAKETRINNDAANDTWKSESKDAPVEPWSASAPALPPIHPLPPLGVLCLDKNRRGDLEQMLLRGKKLIIRTQRRPTNALRSQIYQFSEIHFLATKGTKIKPQKSTKCFL